MNKFVVSLKDNFLEGLFETLDNCVMHCKLTMKITTLIFLSLISNSLIADGHQPSPKVVTVYSYHLKPPFIIDKTAAFGLYFDLLSLVSDQRFEYQLTYVPRKRINKLLENDDLQGVVIGVSPHWFSDSDETKYLWTNSFLEDKDEIISHTDKPFEFSSAELGNKSMAAVRGQFYVQLTHAFENGQLERFDTESEENIIDMVHRQRVDFGVVSRSTLDYLVNKNNNVKAIYISTTPHEEYLRHILVPHQFADVASHLNKRLESKLQTKEWHEVLQRYALD